MCAFEGLHREAMTGLQSVWEAAGGSGGSEAKTSKCKFRVSHTAFCWGGGLLCYTKSLGLLMQEGTTGLGQCT